MGIMIDKGALSGLVHWPLVIAEHLTRDLRRLYEPAFRRAGIKERHFRALFAVSEGALNQTRFADALGVSQNATTSLVDTLERKGWLQRIVNRHNRREKFVELTPKGRAVMERSMRVLASSARTELPESTRVAIEKLSKLIEN